MTKINKENFTKAAKGTGGIQAVIARSLNCERCTITAYVKRNPWAEELLNMERQKIVDSAENMLFNAAEEGKQWAVERILRSLGKDRGYVERTENIVTTDTPTKINIIMPKDGIKHRTNKKTIKSVAKTPGSRD